MPNQTAKVWKRGRVLAYLQEIRKPLEKLDRLAKQSKKIPSSEVQQCLQKIERPLADLENMCDPRLKMPKELQRTIASTVDRLKATEKKVKGWAITETERNQKIIENRGNKK